MNLRLSVVALLVIVSVLVVPLAHAQEIPQPTGFVNDYANVLDAGQHGQLEALLTALEQNTTAEVAVVTVDNVTDIATYSVDLFQAWGIGKQSNDNGVLILYSKQANKIRVTTGYGVEGILPDGKVGRILDDYYVPMRDANRTSDGIVAATVQIANVIISNADEVRAGNAGSHDTASTIAKILSDNVFIIVLVVLFAVTSIVKLSTPKCPTDGKRMKVDSTERSPDGYNDIVTYKCPVCGRTVKRKRSRSGGAFFLLAMMGGGGGGMGGGGFGGGGTGGGGAGR